jgi:hypothetical protein
MEKTGVKDLKELVSLVLDGVSIVKDAQADGKIGFEDLGLLFKLVPEIGPAVEGIGNIPGEVTDLSEAELNDLAAFILNHHEGVADSEKAKLLIGGALKVIAGVFQIVNGIKA